MDLEVESGDVIRIVLQFLRENNLTSAAHALQEESGVSLNAVDNPEQLIADVRSGKWHHVLPAVAPLKLPCKWMADLYDQMILELLELRESDVARSLLRDGNEAMAWMKREQTDRFLRLEHLAKRNYFDENEVYTDGRRKEQRRADLAEGLKTELRTAPPARLLSLLNQALKWQRHQALLPAGQKFDLFRARFEGRAVEEEAPVEVAALSIKCAKGVHPECALFTPDGQHLITGSSDGFIEVWNFLTGKLRHELPYQTKGEEKLMAHKTAVLALCCSADSEMLLSGSQDGQIKGTYEAGGRHNGIIAPPQRTLLWEIATGKCLRRFMQAHQKGITSLSFGKKDPSHVLSSSFDETVRGKLLKVFREHTSFVHEAIWAPDGEHIISCSSDGTVKLWDIQTTDCVKTISLERGAGLETTINSVIAIPNTEDVIVCNRTNTIHKIDMRGNVKTTFSNDKPDERFVHAMLTPCARYLYGLTEGRGLVCFSMANGEVAHEMQIHEKEVIGLAHHPHRNLVVSFAHEPRFYLWKALDPEV